MKHGKDEALPSALDGTIVVHDMSGHPFQVQLSRELASRGHRVVHIYCSSFEGPKGDLTTNDDDPPSLTIEAIDLGGKFAKYSLVRRLIDETRYSWRLARRVGHHDAAVLVSSNTPLIAGALLQLQASVRRMPVVFWLQDIYAPALVGLLENKSAPLARIAGSIAWRIERGSLRHSSEVVVITEDFRPVLDRWGVDLDTVSVIENWAPVDEIPVRPRNNQWRERHGLADKLVFLYSGTLGLKHDPSLIRDLAAHLSHRDDVHVVVASEGVGSDWLRDNASDLKNLTLLGYQPYEELPDMMGAADVLLAILEPEASVFSVPSKVLSYHCAGRPILASVPAENLAARIIDREGSGIAVHSTGPEDFLAAAEKLAGDEGLRSAMGLRGREYAERRFPIEGIGDRFEALIARALHRK